MSNQTSRSDLFGGMAWIGFGVLILTESLRMDRFTKMGATLYTMPGFVPGILGCILMVLGAGLAWRGWRRSQRVAASSEFGSSALASSARLLNQRIALALPLCLIYAAGLIGRAPFWLATALFIAVFTYCFAPQVLGRNKKIVSALTSGLITTAVVIGVFQYIFLVRLP